MDFSFSKETKIFFLLIICFFIAALIALVQHSSLSSYEIDGSEFLFDAERILSGKGYNSDFWPFGYMAAVAGLSFISGADLYSSAKTITFLSALGALILTFLIGKKIFSKKASLLAALILATNHLFFVHSFIVETDMLFVCLFLLSLYFLVRGDSSKDYLIAGCAAGLAYMVKYAIYAIFPVIIFFAILKLLERKTLTAITRPAIFLCFFLITSSPWLINNTLRNGNPLYSKHYVNIAWGMNRPQPMPESYWGEYFRLNEKYASMKNVLLDTEKFLKNWVRNIWRLPENIFRVFALQGFFVLPAYLMLFRTINRQKLILALITFSFLCLVTVAYTWDRYLLPLVPVFSILIAYIAYEILPRIISLENVVRGLLVRIPFRTVIMALFILLSMGKTYNTTKQFLQEQTPEFKVAGEWLKGKIKQNEWLMVPRPQVAWYANTDKFVNYPKDRLLPIEYAVKMREQTPFLFIQEGLSTKIIAEIDYFIYDKRFWKRRYPSLMSNDRPKVPANFVQMFSTEGPKTEIIVYRVEHTKQGQ